jgi:hypothetical protein
MVRITSARSGSSASRPGEPTESRQEPDAVLCIPLTHQRGHHQANSLVAEEVVLNSPKHDSMTSQVGNDFNQMVGGSGGIPGTTSDPVRVLDD